MNRSHARVLSRAAANNKANPVHFYRTRNLAGTLNDPVDFDYSEMVWNMRFTVSAMKVKGCELVNFDRANQAIGVGYIMLSGSLFFIVQ